MDARALDPPRRRPTARVVALGFVAGLTLAALGEGGRVLIGRNFHTVEPGRVYRCAQPSPERLDALIRTYGIRTVVNLRGCCADMDWYRAECRVTARLDINQEDLCFSAGRLPSVPEVRRLAEVFARCDYPILLHCQRGADRTGLAAAVFALLNGRPYAEGRRLLGPRFGHVALGRPANLDRFFDLYETYLRERGFDHSAETFRIWILKEYCPGGCRAELTLLDAPPWLPARWPSGVRVRCRNASGEVWRFRPGSNAGTHVNFTVVDAGNKAVAVGKAGLFAAEVPPGESLDVTLALPGLPPGSYLLLVDLCEEQHCSYFQTGSEPLEWEFDVRE